MRAPVCLLAVSLHLAAAPPEPPTGLVASDGAFPARVLLAWNHVRGATLYRVFRGAVNDPAAAQMIGTTASITFSDNITDTTRFLYWVRAENADGASALSAPDQGFVGGGTAALTGAAPAMTVPGQNPVTGAKVFLGKTLFWDEQLSSTRTTACGTCHQFRSGGSDGRAIAGALRSRHPGPDGIFNTADDVFGSMGVPRTLADGSYRPSPIFGLGPQVTPRRVSSVLDAAFASPNGNAGQRVLWDGRATGQFRDPDTGVIFTFGGALESQVFLALLNPTEMAHEGRTHADVVARIREVRPLALAPTIPAALERWIAGRSYPELFEEAFGTPEVTALRVALAIASYERVLLGEQVPAAAPATPATTRGVQLFTQNGCTVCHTLPLVSDNGFHATGVRPPEEDLGLGGVNNIRANDGMFRTPTLRNVGARAGVFHIGRATIEDAVAFYARGGDFRTAPLFALGRPLFLTQQQRADLISFLRYQLLDPRVLNEAAPLFDRPVLYSESARVPVLVGAGVAGPDGRVPEAVALEPPFAGSPRFTVALGNVPAGARVVLVVDRREPAAGAIPGAGSFFRFEGTTQGEAGQGYVSASFPLPADGAGTTLYGRWYVETAAGMAASRLIRFTIFEPRPEPQTFLSTSAASLNKGRVARGSIVTGKGDGLAAGTHLAESTDLPRLLGGVQLLITDREGAEHRAPLYFVSPSQINYLVPREVAEGEALVRVLRDGQEVARGRLQVAASAPGLFTANGDGWDAASGTLLRVTAAGEVISSGLTRFDEAVGRWVPAPVNLGVGNDQAYLVLYGTGLGGVTRATVAGLDVPLEYAGPQGSYPGLDQVNLRLPRLLANFGTVDVVVWAGEERSNTVRIQIQ